MSDKRTYNAYYPFSSRNIYKLHQNRSFMPVAGFSFTKFNVEREGAGLGKLKINNHIGIKTVEKKELQFGQTPQPGIRFGMELNVQYMDENDKVVASVTINGDVFFLEEKKTIDEIAEKWKKGKNIDKEIMKQVLGASYNRSNIQAVVLTKDMGLPAPIQLPRIEFK